VTIHSVNHKSINVSQSVLVYNLVINEHEQKSPYNQLTITKICNHTV